MKSCHLKYFTWLHQVKRLELEINKFASLAINWNKTTMSTDLFESYQSPSTVLWWRWLIHISKSIDIFSIITFKKSQSKLKKQIPASVTGLAPPTTHQLFRAKINQSWSRLENGESIINKRRQTWKFISSIVSLFVLFSAIKIQAYWTKRWVWEREWLKGEETISIINNDNYQFGSGSSVDKRRKRWRWS